MVFRAYRSYLFLSTPSVRRATNTNSPDTDTIKISIHALRAEGDYISCVLARGDLMISIHALRAEGDGLSPGRNALRQMISIHALRAEGDAEKIGGMASMMIFLSTPSVRRATAPHLWPQSCAPISIHALRAEGDLRSKNGRRA